MPFRFGLAGMHTNRRGRGVSLSLTLVENLLEVQMGEEPSPEGGRHGSWVSLVFDLGKTGFDLVPFMCLSFQRLQ